MGVLLSICFKSQADTTAPVHQLKRGRRGGSSGKPRDSRAGGSGKRQGLLGDRPASHPSQGPPSYSSTRPASPRIFSDHGEKRKASWGKPGAPLYMESESAPGAFMTPPASPRDDNRSGPPPPGRSLSLRIPGPERHSETSGTSKGKRSLHRSATSRK